MEGQYRQTAASTVEIELGAVESDTLHADGLVVLAGTLRVLPVSGATLTKGALYTIITSDVEVSERFTTVTGPVLNISYQPKSVTIEITWIGDANCDGWVDDDDLSLLLANWGQDAGWDNGNFNGDNTVDDDDLSLLLANWTGSATVPEPASAFVLLTGLVAVTLRGRRK